MNRDELGRKFARFATHVAVRTPGLWAVVRPVVRRMFDAIAPQWDSYRMPDSLLPFETALAEVHPPPARALDLGTGTGAGAFAIAQRFPSVEVVGFDLAAEMLEQARRNTPEELRGRITFEQGDASKLPFGDGEFQLVAHANMIPFFDEVARVLAPGGYVLFAFSSGATTPIYVPLGRLRAELSRRGFTDFAEFAAGRGTALLARKAGGA